MGSTKGGVNRRKLVFNTIDDVLTDVDRILNAEAAGRLRAMGQWTPGEVLTHLAAWIDYGYNGYPMKAPPFFIRWYLKSKFKQILAKGMDPGVRIPGVKDGTYGMEKISIVDAAARFKASLLRLKKGEPCPYDSPAFGPMSMTDRIRLNLRHAELHLSFLQV